MEKAYFAAAVIGWLKLVQRFKLYLLAGSIDPRYVCPYTMMVTSISIKLILSMKRRQIRNHHSIDSIVEDSCSCASTNKVDVKSRPISLSRCSLVWAASSSHASECTELTFRDLQEKADDQSESGTERFKDQDIIKEEEEDEEEGEEMEEKSYGCCFSIRPVHVRTMSDSLMPQHELLRNFVAPSQSKSVLVKMGCDFEFGKDSEIRSSTGSHVSSKQMKSESKESRKVWPQIAVRKIEEKIEVDDRSVIIDETCSEGWFSLEQPQPLQRSHSYDNSEDRQSVRKDYCCNPVFGGEEELMMATAPNHKRNNSIRPGYMLHRLMSVLDGQSSSVFKSYTGNVDLDREPSEYSYKSCCYKSTTTTLTRRQSDHSIQLDSTYKIKRLESVILDNWNSTYNNTKPQGTSNINLANTNSNNVICPSPAFHINLQSKPYIRTPSGLPASKYARKTRHSRSISLESVILPDRNAAMLNPMFLDGYHSHRYDSMSTGSSSIRTSIPFIPFVEVTPGYKPCHKRIDSNSCPVYDNPVQTLSFCSFDSDFDVSSLVMRNPMSKLSSFLEVSSSCKATDNGAVYGAVDGIDKSGIIELSELKGMPYARHFVPVQTDSNMKNCLLQKYLMQNVLDEIYEAAPRESDLDVYTACVHQFIKQKTDEQLRLCLMDRFLMDNLINEIDRSPEALEVARLKAQRCGQLK